MGVQQGTVTSGNPVVISVENLAPPITISIYPGSGNTSKVEFSSSRQASQNPGAANWQLWSPGNVTAATTEIAVGKLTALRFTVVSGSSTDQYEVVT